MAAYLTSDSVVKKFLNNGYPYFSFYVNGIKVASNENINDIEEASEKLRDELLTYEHNEVSSWDDKIVVYTFASNIVMQKVGKTDISHKCSAALTVRFPDKRQNNTYKNDNANFQVLQILQEMRNDMNVQREKLASLEAEMQNDDDDDVDDNLIIGALKNNPEIINGIVTSAAMALGSIFKKSTPVTALGSVDIDDEKLSKSLEILKENDEKLADHLEILANMAINNPGQFKWLLSMLK